jgi:hypothetical protein
MKNMVRSKNTIQALWSALKTGAFGVLFGVLLASGWTSAQEAPQKPGVSPEQQKRIEQMKSQGTEASLTILPVRLAGEPFDRVSEVVGLLLERQGLKNIELAKATVEPAPNADMESLSVSASEFVKQHPITTDYALYAEINGDRQKHVISELRAVVVDQTGAVVWTDRLTPQDEAFKKVEDPDAMGFSVLLAERLSPQMGLNEKTARAAKPGRMAALMDERSGMPPENERTPLPERQREMKESKQKATLMVFPVRIGGKAVDEASATHLAKMIHDAGLCKAVAAKQSVLLKATHDDPNELKALWDMAREFRDYAKKNPADADYVLYADYAFNPQHWEQGIVHFVVCDRTGEWVIVDLQNSHQPDYQSVKPTSREDCDKLLVKRLTGYLK